MGPPCGPAMRGTLAVSVKHLRILAGGSGGRGGDIRNRNAEFRSQVVETWSPGVPVPPQGVGSPYRAARWRCACTRWTRSPRPPHAGKYTVSRGKNDTFHTPKKSIGRFHILLP